MTGNAAGLFDGLFDDAALFPPGNAPMATAVPAHREVRSRWGRLIGPFILPAARLDEFVAELDDGDGFPISLIATAGDLPAAVARVAADPRLLLAAVEVPSAVDAAAAAQAVRVLSDVLPTGVPAAVELPRTGARDDVLNVLAAAGHRAKLRTGGLRAELFPSPAELVDALRACITRQVPLKCTAGLHSAVRHTDPVTGFHHHGFLNVLLTVDALAAGALPLVAPDWLQEDDGTELAAAVRTWPTSRVARARAAFTSFGTCSVLEPVDDLVSLGLLPSTERIPA
ncbi:hypothetical protein SAMN05661080_03134 [Modestobacter sp. DSM 44400]|uniref:hypothetical protein n=1 Tax=Modestobacter sp. DSM 44400 TaxID=1550230 RepID=UPI0008942801|nr:hypothetical protein [Modestobacter sp. DSM 44400]SDY34203.1 hypothetical protein SAMN05661080_03134 [Modestobacter sp. DSM 44400]